LIGVYGDKRKKRKVIVIPEHDTSFQKWCNLCETIKEHKDFYSDKAKKDGLNANCKACKASQKKKKKIPTPDINPVVDSKIIHERNPLERYSKNELRELAREKGIKFTFKKTKDELLKMIQTTLN
jgi:tRNA U34 2-thiouridine synthase MnmA/TrmU